MKPRIRVLVAIAHRNMRQGVRLLLGSQADFEVVGEARHPDETLRLAESLHPDVLVLDLRLPGGGTGEFPRKILAISPSTRIVPLHLKESELATVNRTAAQNLMLQIRELTSRRRWEPDGDGAEASRHPGRATKDPLAILTPREREVLLVTVEGCSSREAARRLGISPRTAESHRARIMRKLGLHRRAELVRFAVERGIIAAAPSTKFLSFPGDD